ncbi:transposase, partial [Pantoea stewartii]
GFQLGLNMLVILRSHHFDTAEQVAAFLGVVPVERSSGTSVRNKPKLSKNGPPEIRAKLYLSSMCGLRFNPAMKAIYERLCLSGKAKMCAIGALMRKHVHWCYGVLKTQKPFDAEYLSSDARSACKAA